MGGVTAGPTNPLRVLVIDDSALMRCMLVNTLQAEGLRVAGVARDGEEGLTKLRELAPDVVLLDVEMPRRNGVEFLSEAMRTNPVRVVVLSSLTTAGSHLAVQCLALGAFACLAKPDGADGHGIRGMASELARTIRNAAAARLLPAVLRPPARPRLPLAAYGRPIGHPSGRPARAALVVAASAGGPAALQQVVAELPPDLPAGVLIVQHLPIGFTAALAERMDASAAMPVREAVAGERVREGQAYVAPAGWHMEIDVEGSIFLHQQPPVWGVRPAADVTLVSCAKRFGSRVVACVLTGMGRDGAEGAGHVRQAGGVVLAQDEATSVVWGMPRAVYEAGAASALVPLGAMAGEAARWVRQVAAGARTAA